MKIKILGYCIYMARQLRQTRGRKDPRKTRKQGKRKGGKTRKRVMGKRRKRTMRKVRRGGVFSSFFTTKAKTDGEVLEKLKKDFIVMNNKVKIFYTDLEAFSQRKALVKKFPDLLRGYKNLHNEANTRLLGLAGLTRGSDIHQAYHEVLRLKSSIDERMEGVAGMIGLDEDFVQIDLPKLKEVSPEEENQNVTGLQQPPEPQQVASSQQPPEPPPVARDPEQQKSKRNAFGLLEHRGENYLSESQAE